MTNLKPVCFTFSQDGTMAGSDPADYMAAHAAECEGDGGFNRAVFLWWCDLSRMLGLESIGPTRA